MRLGWRHGGNVTSRCVTRDALPKRYMPLRCPKTKALTRRDISIISAMPRKKTFKVLAWPDLPAGHPVSEEYDLMCACGREAICPIAKGGIIEGRIGMGFVVDPGNPPPYFYMPSQIKCRKCGRKYELEGKGGQDVR